MTSCAVESVPTIKGQGWHSGLHMIIEVPSYLDFEEAGVSMLNLGWNAVADLFRDLELADVKSWDDDGKTTEEFWDAAKHPMSIALALVQQGIELLLKA